MRTTGGNVPMPTKKHPARESPCDLFTSNNSQPKLATEKEIMRKIPRFRSLSEAIDMVRVDIAVATYTGTVRSCVVMVLYPNDLTIGGRKLLKPERLMFIMQ